MEATEKNLYLREIINKKNRERLKNTDFSLISSNCNGAFILHDLGLRFNSPTVNLFLNAKDYIKFLKKLDYYLSLNLVFNHNTNLNYPVGVLDDISIFFMHYKTEEEAKNKWEERKKRINYNNLFILMTDRDGCTIDDIKEFDSLDYKNKIIFTHLPHPEIKSCYYIKGFENENQVGLVYEFKNKDSGEKYYDDFDYVSWFNNK